MNRTYKTVASVVVVIAAFAMTLHSQSTAADELNLGVQAYKQARYEEAIQHFEKAATLAPENGLAHMYLATAYAQQYIPGMDTPENDRSAEHAIEQYQQVLDSDMTAEAKINGAKGIASLYLNMKKFEDAKKEIRPDGLGPRPQGS